MRHTALASLLLLAGSVNALAATLPFDLPQTLDLGSGATLELDLDSSVGGGVAIEVLEQGIDVSVTLNADGKRWRGFDGDLLRCGLHRIAVSTLSAPARLSIAATRPGSPDGKVRVKASRQRSNDAVDATRFGLDLLETNVAQQLFDPKASREPASVEQTRQLAAGRLAAGENADAGRAYLLLDQLLMRQLRYDEAVAALESALPIFRVLKDQRAEASVLNDIGMHYARKGEGSRSAEPLEAALVLALAAKDQLLSSLIKNNICQRSVSRVSTDAVIACQRTALTWSEPTGDLLRIGTDWNNLGGAYSNAGRVREAISAFEKAAELRERAGSRVGQAQTLANLGLEYQGLGRFDQTEALFRRVEELYRAANDEHGLGMVLRYRGQLRMRLGNYGDAVALLQEALSILRRVGERSDLIVTLTRLGEAQRLRDGPEQVPAALNEALALVEVDADPQLLADVLTRVAQVHVDAGRLDAATPFVLRARALADKLGDAALNGLARLLDARIALVRGDTTGATAMARAAEPLLRGAGAVLRLAEAIGIEADASFAQKKYEQAAATYGRAIVTVAGARASVVDPELRARFFATQTHLHQGQVAALAESALELGDAATSWRALTASDAFRAQVLSERLATRTLVEDAGTGLAATDTLRQREAALASARWRLVESGASAASRAAVERDLAEVSAQLAEHDRRQMRRSLTASSTSLRQMRLPSDFSVVEFATSPDSDYAWIVTAGHIELHRFPGERTLRPLVDAARAALLASDQNVGWSDSLSALCDAVWDPLAGGVKSQRVALVLDGSLQSIPWSALRCADGSGTRTALIEHYELSSIPALRSLRDRPGAKGRGDVRVGALAVVDPIYSRRDTRLGVLAVPGESTVASDALALRGRSLVRLTATHEEAALLQRLLGADQVTVLDGFDADREAVLDRLVQPLHLIHFGTHGIVSGDDLAGSGLVLSLLDREAHPKDGFLNAREVARLPLAVDLVVMAACESGHGAEIEGEGLQSLSYGFLAAGADSVVASSWPVADAPTSRLMAEFYAAFLEQRQSPAASLRAAQRILSRDPLWRHPRYWAGFAVQSGGTLTP